MNKKNIVLDALTNKDHQIVLAIIYWLESCHNRKEFNQVVETALIPLLGCSGVFYVSFESNENTPQLLESIPISDLCQHQWNDVLIAAMRTHASINYAESGASSVLPSDMSYSNGISHFNVNDNCTMTVLFDDPKKTIALCICQLDAETPHNNPRYIELLKLLRSTLLQSIKTILFHESSQNQQQTMDRRSVDGEPLAVVSDEGVLIYKNKVYDQTVAKDDCTFLSSVFSQANIIKRRKTESYCLL